MIQLHRTLPRLGALLALAAAPALARQEIDEELERLLAQERAEADLSMRRGELQQALRLLDAHLDDEPADAASRALRARCRFQRGEHAEALADARQALADAGQAPRALRAECARTLVELELAYGDYAGALATLDARADVLDPATDPRDAWILGRALWEAGDRDAARRVLDLGVSAPREGDWRALLAKARCERAAGRLERASVTIVAADAAAVAAGGPEPDVLAMLGELYFESEREVEAQGQRSAGAVFKEARDIHPGHEAALLGLFGLHRYNFKRQSESPSEILEQLFAANPGSIEGWIARTAADLQDGQLKSAREGLAKLRGFAAARREVRTLEAALAWIEHRRDDCLSILAGLAETSPADSRPEREVGRLLNELYRFGEALPMLSAATERDPSDYEAWTQLGRALANTGDEDGARDALEKARIAARGRQDAWRNNMALVLKRMEAETVEEDFGELSFAWKPDAAAVLRTYLVPFYRAAREELAERYGYTPAPTHIEVFRRHRDFSVRSVGFPGFPALGVCFGPVITSLSPLSEMRGDFSWARTSFHEFSHVIHLGLSHNRCPRWVTEGLATWEEVRESPAWTRNMRRELVDARANDELIPVRGLNRAFRGPRILFGYYQGGLLCEMLIAEHGFPPMIRLLEAFDRGLDLDQAFAEVFQTTPEEVDAAFLAFVDERTAGLSIEPRWNPQRVARLRLELAREAPQDPEARPSWAEGMCTLAWGSWQAHRKVDAQEALRRLRAAGLEPPRALFLRGEMALAERDTGAAIEHWQRAVEAGGRDYRALVALASLVQERGELDEAQRLLLDAENAFPGFPEQRLSAELRLVALHQARGEVEAANRAKERWLAWNADELGLRREIAAWHVENGRPEEALRFFAEANEIDPFLGELHRSWGDALRAAGRTEEALREYRVAALVPAELDADLAAQSPRGDVVPFEEGVADEGGDAAEPEVEPEAADPGQTAEGAGGAPPVGERREWRAELLALQALCLDELGLADQAREARAKALELDPDCELARERPEGEGDDGDDEDDEGDRP